LLPKPVKANSRRVEFIGDSLTCGYADLQPSSVPCSPNSILREYESSYLAWSGIVARNLDVEAHFISYSGRGVIRNYNDSNMVSLYPQPKYYM